MKATTGAVEVAASDLAKSNQGTTGGGFAQDLFNKQKAYFATDVTKTYKWRIDQLDRLSRMVKENNERFSEASRRDFKTAIQENIFEVSVAASSLHCSFRRQPVHIEALGGDTCDRRVATGIDPEVGQTYAEHSPTPASLFDHQKGYIDFWLHFIGVEKTHSIVIENTWSDREAENLAKGKSEAIRLVEQL